MSRAGALTIAEHFLRDQGYRLEDYRQAAQFTFDDQAKTFLERELGLERANRIMGSRVRLWRWAYRWFRPLQKEEYNVEITPAGQLAGFQHVLPEDAARPTATPAQARALAEDFLRTRLARDPASLDFVESTDVARAHRIDRTFTWKERDFQLDDATYRLEVTILGNEVGGYREYLKIPEQWTRDYQRLRSKNEVAATIDTALTLMLVVGMLIVIVMRVRRHDVPWRRASLVGLVAIVLGFLAQLNEFPLHEFGYPTTDSYSSFLSREFLNALLSALGAGGLLFVLTAGAEPLYRETFGDKISLGNLFTLRGLRTRHFFLGSILGITLTGIFIAYQTGFYILAYKRGAWSPADVPYTDLLNTRFPWAFVLFGGFLPAVSEEFLFRMFAIPFLRKLTRNMAVAVVLAGFIWGFGHASYPQQPFFIRGLEVGIGGVALGIIMLRFGILPTLVWHYSVDAMYSAMLLVRSESLYFKLSGFGAAGIMVLPICIALVAYWYRGGFEPETGLLNRDDVAEPGLIEEPAGAAAAEPPRHPAPKRRPRFPSLPSAPHIRTLGRCRSPRPRTRLPRNPRRPLRRFDPISSFPASAHASPPTPSSRPRVSTPRRSSTSLIPPSIGQMTIPWQANTSWSASPSAPPLPCSSATAPCRSGSRATSNRSTRKRLPSASIPETARITGFGHTIPENRPGADLSPEPAREIAARFADSIGWDTTAMDLKESSAEMKKARRDYSLEWEARPGDPRNVDQTRWRVEVNVSGDRVTSARGFWKLPEDWQRGRERENAIAIAISVLRIVTLAGFVVYALWLLIQGTRQGIVRWRPAIRLAIPATILFPVAPLLSAGLDAQELPHRCPARDLPGPDLCHARHERHLRLPLPGRSRRHHRHLLSRRPARPAPRKSRRPGPRCPRRPGRRPLVFRSSFRNSRPSCCNNSTPRPCSPSPARISSPAPRPALAAVSNAVRALLTDAALLGLLTLLAWQLTRPWMRYAAALLALCATVPSEVRTPGEFILQYTISLAMAAAALAFCWFFARRNYLAYALVFWLIALRTPMMQLLGTGNPALQMQGYLIAAIMAATLIWAFAPALLRRSAHPTLPDRI